MSYRNLIVLVCSCICCASCAFSRPSVVGSFYRPDTAFPEFAVYWGDTAESSESSLGAAVHVFLRNPGQEPLPVEDVLLEGISLKRAVAHSEKKRKGFLHPASIYFSDLPEPDRERLAGFGEPVWWRVEPQPIPAGGFAEVLVRFRSKPTTSTLRLSIVGKDGSTDLSVRVQEDDPRMESISFSHTLDKVCLYLRYPKGLRRNLLRIRMDGQDVTGDASIGSDPDLDVTPLVISLKRPVDRGSFHFFEVVYDNGRRAYAGIRAWSDELAYGMWGAMPGKEHEVDVARRYVRDLYEHNVNVQMEMVGSAAVREFLKSDEGQQLCETLGIRRMVDYPGKGKTRNPYCYFLVDEPDCGDYRVEDLPHPKRVGSLAQGLALHSAKLREIDPLTPHLLNVDMTYKPENWYNYAQVPDIFAADPYYQERLRASYWEHPEHLPLYQKATFVYAVGSICQSACAPKPLHLILNSVRHTKPERRFRYATPEEKRIEVYYSLAAGAKGISYWWYTPSGTYYGCGASDPQAVALWTEIGLLGAELRTAGEVITQSCPAEIPCTVPSNLWVRSLLAGLDTLIVICVNDDYENNESGTVLRPIEKAEISIDLPEWLKPKDVFEVSAKGIQDVPWKTAGDKLSLDLGGVEVTRLVLITADSEMRSRLQNRYQAKLAGTTANLLKRK
jgi:hypothetical protein